MKITATLFTCAERNAAQVALLYLLPQDLTWGNRYAREKLVPNQFPIGRRPLREKLATWTMVLFPAGSSEATDALPLWKQAAQLGSLADARNAYRAYLLRDWAPKVESDMVLRPLNLFCNFKSSESNLRYLSALVLLDELSGYPLLDKANEKEGRTGLETAKAAGSTAAAARLAR